MGYPSQQGETVRRHLAINRKMHPQASELESSSGGKAALKTKLPGTQWDCSAPSPLPLWVFSPSLIPIPSLRSLPIHYLPSSTSRVGRLYCLKMHGYGLPSWSIQLRPLNIFPGLLWNAKSLQSLSWLSVKSQILL